jgi:flagellar hook-basal body complex protein FliE
MKPSKLIVILLLSLGGKALADDQSDRQKLLGSWELQGTAENNPATSWTFSTAKNSLRVTQQDASGKVADFTCGTEGVSCDVKTAGKKATVSLWFNGPRLVEMETKGSDVVKRRFTILPQGDVMEMEVIPIVPSGKTESVQFKRAQLTARQE